MMEWLGAGGAGPCSLLLVASATFACVFVNKNLSDLGLVPAENRPTQVDVQCRMGGWVQGVTGPRVLCCFVASVRLLCAVLVRECERGVAALCFCALVRKSFCLIWAMGRRKTVQPKLIFSDRWSGWVQEGAGSRVLRCFVASVRLACAVPGHECGREVAAKCFYEQDFV
jgi:hypothetical protein